jgi:CPA1 family monovalent cation:H+ antiporter
LIKSLNIGSDEADCREHEKEVRLQAINEAQKFIAKKQVSMRLPDFAVEYVQASHDHRILHLDHANRENEIVQLSVNLHREALAIERATVVALRNQGHISDEVLHRIERDLDIEELRLPESEKP